MDLSNGIRQIRWGQNKTYAPACDGIGFAHAVYQYSSFPHSRQCRYRYMRCTIVNDVLIDFVSNCKGVEFLTKFCDHLQLGASEYLAGGVVRRVQYNRLGLR